MTNAIDTRTPQIAIGSKAYAGRMFLPSAYPTLNETIPDDTGHSTSELPQLMRAIIDSVACDLLADRDVFISGSAGTGKSVLVRQVSRILEREWNGPVIRLAPTGVAAINIDGLTMHSFFKMSTRGTGVVANMVPDLDKTGFTEVISNALMRRRMLGSINAATPSADVSKLESLFPQKPAAMIIDEISMVRRDYFEFIVTARDMLAEAGREMGMDLFVPMLVIGDFLQLPPVVPEDAQGDLYGSYKTRANPATGAIEPLRPGSSWFAFESPAWWECDFKRYVFDVPLRQGKDMAYFSILDRIRHGDSSAADDLYARCRSEKSDDTSRTRIYGVNNDARDYNRWAIRHDPAIEVDTMCYYDTQYACIHPDPSGAYRNRTVTGRNDIPDKQQLAVGATVVCIANDTNEEYCNGDVGRITEIDYGRSGYVSGVWVRLNRVNDRGVHPVVHVKPKIMFFRNQFSASAVYDEAWRRWNSFKDFESDLNAARAYYGLDAANRSHASLNDIVENADAYAKALKGTLPMHRMVSLAVCGMRYMPLLLGYAFTAHKSQGKTLSDVDMFPSRFFADGQFYVAASRCEQMSGLHICEAPRPNNIRVNVDALAFVMAVEHSTSPLSSMSMRPGQVDDADADAYGDTDADVVGDVSADDDIEAEVAEVADAVDEADAIEAAPDELDAPDVDDERTILW